MTAIELVLELFDKPSGRGIWHSLSPLPTTLSIQPDSPLPSGNR
jgi:hypothetical protein